MLFSSIFPKRSTAFHTMQRLLLKLENIGVRGNLLAWHRAFLTNRYQRVLVDGLFGRMLHRVFRRVLYSDHLIYVNNVEDGLRVSSRLFADDCVIYREVNDHLDCELLQRGLDRIYSWTQSWQLNLNLAKCKLK